MNSLLSRNARIFFILLLAIQIKISFGQLGIPYEQTFSSAGLPAGWTVQYSGITATVWSVLSSNNAGGTVNEAVASSTYQIGTSRLVTPGFTTGGLSSLRLSFRQKFWGGDNNNMCIKIQTSTDGVSWTDEDYIYSGENGSIEPEYKSLLLHHNLNDTTYIAFVVEGSHSGFLKWYIDDIYIGEYTAQAVCPFTMEPQSFQTNVSLIGTLKWRSGLYAMGNVVYMGTDNPPTNVINGVDVGLQQQYDYPALQPGTVYKWKVMTYNNNGVKPFCSNMQFTTIPKKNLPYADSFHSPIINPGWAMQVTSFEENTKPPSWELKYGHKAGGTTYEIGIEDKTAQGISRLVSPPFNTQGLTEISLQFNHKIETVTAGLTFKLQSSTDGINWTDEQVWSGGEGDLGPEPFFTAIHHNLGNYTMISFVVEGDFSTFMGWYIDNLVVENVTAAPACVSFVSPPDSSFNVSPAVNLSWNPVPGAAGYKIFLGTDFPPSNVYEGLDLGNKCVKDFGSLSPGLTYFWNISPYNQVGTTYGCPVNVVSAKAIQAIPLHENFDSPDFPAGWLAQWTENVDSSIWSISPTGGAGGLPNTLKASGQNYSRGISRMIIPPVAAGGAYDMMLDFRYNIYLYDTSVIVKIQSSTDGRNWHDENWKCSLLSDNYTAHKARVLIPHTDATYLAFVVTGDHNEFQFWYIDSVNITPVYSYPSGIPTPSPSSQSMAVPLNKMLAWTPVPDAKGYKFYLGTSDPPGDIINGLDMGKDTSWNASGFFPNHLYFWKVVPYNDGGDAMNSPVWNFTTTDLFSLPLQESFNTSTFPAGWTLQQYKKKTIWSMDFSSYAGGAPREMKATYISGNYPAVGYARLVSPAIQTAAIAMLHLTFRHRYVDNEAGATLRVQTSGDGIHWTNSNWHYHSGDGSIDPDTVDIFLGVNGYFNFIAFTIEGNLISFYNWYIDNIEITAASAVPACSNLIYPPTNLMDASEKIKLTWEMNPLATSYTLWLGTDDPPTNIIGNLSLGPVNEYEVGPLPQGDEYYWQIVPFAPTEIPSGCAIHNFTVTENKSLPYFNSFDTWYFPGGWRQEHSGGITQDIWTVANTHQAGGQPYELKASGFNGWGTTRLISPPLNTTGCEYITCNFRLIYLSDYYNAGIYLESSEDGINWTEEKYLFEGGENMVAPYTLSVKIQHNLGSKTYLAFTIKGNHHAVESWHIDDISIIPCFNGPAIYTMNVPSYYCQGTAGVTVTLDHSQNGAEYTLYNGTTAVGAPVAGTDSALSWTGQMAGTYLIMAEYNGKYAMMAGGKTVVNATLPLVNAGPDITITQGQSTQLQCTVSGGMAPYTYRWTPSMGLSDTVISDPVASPSNTTSYSVQVTDFHTCNSSDTMVVTVNPAALSISGTLVYFNTNLTPLNNCQVQLVQDNNVIQTCTTGISGGYLFTGISPGTYSFNILINKPWGGGNAIDGLLIMKHFVGLSLLSGIQLSAADVADLGNINSIDALFVMRRFAGMVNSFITGDWVTENPPVILTNNNIEIQIKALCFGDVNGTYIPAP